MKKLIYLMLSLFLLPVQAQVPEQDRPLHLHVTTTTSQTAADAVVTLTNTDMYMDYPSPSLDEEGRYSTLVYPGNHHIRVEKPGYSVYEEDFFVAEDAKETTLEIELVEAVVVPYALTTELQHDPLTGKNDVLLSWNKEAPVFFDDFESYSDWSIEFGDWTGIDGDGLAAAPLQGLYPNRGSLQYTIIANPLTVSPAWYYDYPVLRAYSGKQYACFTTTSTGAANDDWLISPAVTIGTDNIVRFMAKAGDVYAERFEVYITEEVDRPAAADFIPLHSGNYESVTYEEWQRMEYDLSDYAGKTVKIAIRYISDRNRYGAFIFMVDDFYVGQREYEEETLARRVSAAARSAANPNEKFELYLGKQKVGETEKYSYLFENLPEGEHILGVKAVYKEAATDITTLPVTVSNAGYHKVEVTVNTNNETSVDGKLIGFTNKDTGEGLSVPIKEGKADIMSLPKGTYLVNLSDKLYESYDSEVVISKDTAWTIELKEVVFTPFNITADVDENEDKSYTAVINWNQDLGFYDSFEEYDDFATEEFGGWKSIDIDQMPVYPISLGTSEVQFPGSSNSGSTKPLAPVVFNPSQTTPSMEADGLVAPTHGSKEIMFLNPQSNMVNYTQTDKWLITPQQNIRENYILRLNAAGYDFSETLEVCISTTEADPKAFTAIKEIQTSYGKENWRIYEIDLSEYAGESVYVGLHCVSYGGWMCLVDEVYIGPKDDAEAEVGKVLEYEVYLDGEFKEKTTEPTYTFPSLAEGEYTVGVKAVYKSGVSEMGTYTFTVKKEDDPNGINGIQADGVDILSGEGWLKVSTAAGTRLTVYNLSGLIARQAELAVGTTTMDLPAGSYIVKVGSGVQKVIVR